MPDWQDELRRLERELAQTELFYGLLGDGVISYDELRELSAQDHRERLVERFRARFNDDELDSLPRAIALGARWSELLRLGVCGLTCQGEDLTTISSDQLRERMKAVAELRSRSNPSKWLGEYAARLAHESRRRRGL